MPEEPPPSPPGVVSCGVSCGAGTPTTSEVNDVTLAPLHSEDVASMPLISVTIAFEALPRALAWLCDEDRVSNWIDTASSRRRAATTSNNFTLRRSTPTSCRQGGLCMIKTVGAGTTVNVSINASDVSSPVHALAVDIEVVVVRKSSTEAAVPPKSEGQVGVLPSEV
eukprot:579440-Rhodomonas_salina.1